MIKDGEKGKKRKGGEEDGGGGLIGPAYAND